MHLFINPHIVNPKVYEILFKENNIFETHRSHPSPTFKNEKPKDDKIDRNFLVRW